ncbi:hypothetical protein N7520_001890 [Penicillium odoratum]|uniref:uncharacterized protein n=1 Tax=Penicillium odoratum TaxID=1167516 RepID=UPI0025474366|nr:uncharacterized protein N7520_001890 [Penicillium odoratum]KAJ5778644.1 hypothetical protein N7520_001890 [Penicillium odoratum]
MPMIHLSGEDEDEVKKISREIDLVVTSRVHEISRQKSLEYAEREFLQQQLTSIENRTYLWVTLTLDYIENTPGFTKGQIRRVINHQIPRTVDEAYDKILNRSSNRDKAKVSLALAVTPGCQSYDGIKDEIEPVERFKFTLRQICGLLLTVIDSKVYLLHQSVKEFLVWKNPPMNYSPPENTWKNTLVLSHSNRVMAETCMRYLLADLDETHLCTFRLKRRLKFSQALSVR